MSPYEILQVSSTASQEVIRAVWVTLIKQCHPDGPKPNIKRTRELNEAYAVLKDPTKRAALDLELAAKAETKRAKETATHPEMQAYPEAYEGFSPDRIDDAIDELTRTSGAPSIVGDFLKFAQRQARRPK